MTEYKLDFTKCSLCGSCVEACRDNAIRYTHQYNLASTNREDFIMDLFKRMEDDAKASPMPETPKPEVAPQPPANEAPKAEQPQPAAPAQPN